MERTNQTWLEGKTELLLRRGIINSYMLELNRQASAVEFETKDQEKAVEQIINNDQAYYFFKLIFAYVTNSAGVSFNKGTNFELDSLTENNVYQLQYLLKLLNQEALDPAKKDEKKSAGLGYLVVIIKRILAISAENNQQHNQELAGLLDRAIMMVGDMYTEAVVKRSMPQEKQLNSPKVVNYVAPAINAIDTRVVLTPISA